MSETTDNPAIPSPVGPLGLQARGGLLVALRFDARVDRAQPGAHRRAGRGGAPARRVLLRQPPAFELALAQPSAPFDRQVLEVVGGIPYGERTSYGQVTAALGLERDQVRKVAAAIGRNPLPISSRATAWWVPTAPSPAMAADSSGRLGYWRSRPTSSSWRCRPEEASQEASDARDASVSANPSIEARCRRVP